MKDLCYAPRLVKTLYFAGGCFWGVQAYFDNMLGVVSTKVGFVDISDNPQVDKSAPKYEDVRKGDTSYLETVSVEYDVDAVSVETLVTRFFGIISPTTQNRQGEDVGFQYNTAIFYQKSEGTDFSRISETFTSIKQRFLDNNQEFYTLLRPLAHFYEAEDFHQDYLVKNPTGYCHLDLKKMHEELPVVDKKLYKNKQHDEIKKNLSPLQYNITQNLATEKPFTGEYDQNFELGIYVDVISGEPLFLSTKKFDSGCGWPAFSAPIEDAVLTQHDDNSIPGRKRTEIRSSSADSHLGHVFADAPEVETGLRYCINSASLKFVPVNDMEKAGYGYLINLLEA
ncbi:MAG: peptide-methionine (R)-S-oxide reductase MsrB [Candidatus Ancillula sp.]|jgi:peptide methionine sulfoxide reductase msrA/msrB|nr:peptide-methionine (R)-S-oxide reductase MsrB [Candidatus Ancillula sp.]